MSQPSTADRPVPECVRPAESGSRRALAGFRLPWAFMALVALLVAGRFLLRPHLAHPALQTWATVFVAVCA